MGAATELSGRECHGLQDGKEAGALFGLTPKIYRSGEKDIMGGITLGSDEIVRTELFEAANVLLSHITRF
ncbi:transposase [Bradyrhizobium sp. CCBAU 53415]|uniref:transposase n=1 Tax=Bradyrhizobium sp. CCBAU 53415 TaxID=1325119 RepID=UPI003FA41958